MITIIDSIALHKPTFYVAENSLLIDHTFNLIGDTFLHMTFIDHLTKREMFSCH